MSDVQKCPSNENDVKRTALRVIGVMVCVTNVAMFAAVAAVRITQITRS